MNGQTCPTQPGEGQAKDLLYQLLLQTAPKLLAHPDMMDAIASAIKQSVDKMVLERKAQQQMQLILGTEDFDNLLILLEGIVEVMRKEKIHSISTLADWMSIKKEIVSVKKEVGHMPSSNPSP